MKMPSKYYFKHIKTEDQWKTLKDSGMAWELEPNFPKSWEEHKLLKKRMEKYDGRL